MSTTHIHGEEEKANLELYGPPNANGFYRVFHLKARHIRQVKAQSLVLGCMDHRFQRCERIFVNEQMEIESFDHLRVPGADLVFAGGASTPEAAMVQSWIDKSIQLHQINGIIVLGHWNCGGHPEYESCEAEERGHEQAILESMAYLSRRYPDLLVTGIYSRLYGKQLAFRKKRIAPVSQSVEPFAGNGHVAVTS